jgi:hypothetical protein
VLKRQEGRRLFSDAFCPLTSETQSLLKTFVKVSLRGYDVFNSLSFLLFFYLFEEAVVNFEEALELET